MGKDKRKFKKHTIEVIVLEEFNGEDVGEMSLEEIASEMHDGSFVGTWNVKKSEDLSESEMAEALCKAGSEPEFLNIDTGEDG